ncbi:hypothetical protein [Cryobacterium sp. HLT2-28]|uniref:hypothetical protein n=1 Tax=Cryobacterium sp. HLT2-28 TaxID=1259146 RepID=UPI00106C46BC|nr:hypothetical protein [Cryobacterium sp. HLT2-28]TFB91399.1 hypothetical protein E3O48_15305 [Cryobacterium sp. HLT2-28]
MDFLLFNVIPYFALTTSIMVPFGLLLHYWRRSDSYELCVPRLESDGTALRLLPIRRLTRRGRLASGIAFVVTILSIAGLWFPNRTSDTWVSFLVPMMTVMVCIGSLLVTPAAARHRVPDLSDPAHRIDLAPRSVWSYGRGWWFASWILVAAALVTTVVLGGLASSRDDQGRYAVLFVRVGNASDASTFLGWYYGVPILITLVALTAVALTALWVIARPPLAATTESRSADLWLRRLRTRTILSLSGGALILTLSWSLLCIGTGASLVLQFPSNDLGPVTVGTPLAALAVPLNVAGLLLQGLGVALLLLPLFTRFPRPAERQGPDSPAEQSNIPVTEPQG